MRSTQIVMRSTQIDMRSTAIRHEIDTNRLEIDTKRHEIVSIWFAVGIVGLCWLPFTFSLFVCFPLGVVLLRFVFFFFSVQSCIGSVRSSAYDFRVFVILLVFVFVSF